MARDGDGTGLQFERVCVDIEDKRILWNVSGHALQGHVLAVLGPSGKQSLPFSELTRLALGPVVIYRFR